MHSLAHRMAGLELVSMAIESHSASMAALTKPLQSGGVVPAPAVGSGVSQAVEKLLGRNTGDCTDFLD